MYYLCHLRLDWFHNNNWHSVCASSFFAHPINNDPVYSFSHLWEPILLCGSYPFWNISDNRHSNDFRRKKEHSVINRLIWYGGYASLHRYYPTLFVYIKNTRRQKVIYIHPISSFFCVVQLVYCWYYLYRYALQLWQE